MRFIKIISLTCCLTFFTCARDMLHTVKKQKELLNTQCQITVKYKNNPHPEKYIKQAFNVIKQIGKEMNAHNPNSELAKINNAGGGELTPHLKFVIEKSIYYSKVTNGLFDITCKPLLDYYKNCEKENRPVRKRELYLIRSLVGSENIKIQGNKIKFLKQKTYTINNHKYSMKIDLGAIAKGYAADLALKELKKGNIIKALVEIGGEVASFTKDQKSGWTIGVLDPLEPSKIIECLEIYNHCLATSGSYFRGYNIRQKRLSHIIDPRTGKSAATRMASVTVIAENCLEADALSTALFLMEPQAAINFVNNTTYDPQNNFIFAIVYTNEKLRLTSKGIERFEFKQNKSQEE